jgi:hypothetical protein
MITLHRSSDRKTANGAMANGKQARVKNAFGLLSGSAYSCPGATEVCEGVCYAGKLEKLFPAMRVQMLNNYNAIANASYEELVEALSSMIDDFRADCVKWSCELAFRIHHDGDFLSRTYASAWANVVKRNPDIQFWAYTRSFIPGHNVVDILEGIPNLALYISVDRANFEWAKVIRQEYPTTVKWAYLGDTNASTKVDMLALFDKPGGICPENVKRIPLITDKGGACFTCQLCVKGKSDIRFAIKKK